MSAAARRLSGGLPDFVCELLAETPVVQDRARQAALTARFLTPRLGQLDALFRALRAGVDTAMREARPTFGGKPYPLGQCLWITQAVQARLEDDAGAAGATLSGAAAEGWTALAAFRAAGGRVRRTWGDLRDQYFQNALVVGTLYVDVSNDTVVRTKPPVEILPFEAAGFRPVADFAHFARIAERYWGHRVLPNHVLPQLAPYLPLVEIGPTGQVRFGTFNRCLLGTTLSEGFAPSEAALAGAPMPPGVFAGVGAALAGGPLTVAQSAEAGRLAALRACRSYRARGLDVRADAYAQAIAAGQAANRALATLVAVPQGA
jgi:hypothetical protein